MPIKIDITQPGWWMMIPAYSTRKGHLRIGRYPYRNQYVHRVVADLLIKVWNPFGWTELPGDYAVHHIDFNKQNNAPANLLLLDPVLHNWLTGDGMPRDVGGRFKDGMRMYENRAEEVMGDEWMDALTA